MVLWPSSSWTTFDFHLEEPMPPINRFRVSAKVFRKCLNPVADRRRAIWAELQDPRRRNPRPIAPPSGPFKVNPRFRLLPVGSHAGIGEELL